MSNFEKENENIDTVIKEVMEDVIAAVVSDSIEATVQSVLQDVLAMEFGYGEHLHLDTNTENIMDKDRRMVAIVDASDASVNGEVVLRCGDEEDIQVNGGDIDKTTF
ncbi:unnamed protein product [Macrosiphum euphorbiae]|uniref:Uncharacterized protein n=1 Tax=Macrosiphum euphorbiae TaxID=13131 RepID=A0AAV0XB33_9HEMI|nr:unnamed protein product [Macrosiphum euphorbiae]